MTEEEKEAIGNLRIQVMNFNEKEDRILLKYIEKLQKENEEYHRIKKDLIRVNKKIYDVDTIDEFIKTIDKLQKENTELKEENIILEGNKIGYKLAIQELRKENEEKDKIKIVKKGENAYDVLGIPGTSSYENYKEAAKKVSKYIDKLQQDNKESKELYNKLLIGYNKLVQEYLELEKENQELKEENKKISKAADKMYEYISYYGWEDFESNTGCNREEMVDYFYKE